MEIKSEICSTTWTTWDSHPCLSDSIIVVLTMLLCGLGLHRSVLMDRRRRLETHESSLKWKREYIHQALWLNVHRWVIPAMWMDLREKDLASFKVRHLGWETQTAGPQRPWVSPGVEGPQCEQWTRTLKHPAIPRATTSNCPLCEGH